MRALYFDCSSGISGNMTLGALLELIDDQDYLLQELHKLNAHGYHVDISNKVKNGITATYVDVIIEHHEHHDDDSHEHHHEHRNLYDVTKIIDDSDIDDKAKELAKRIFLRVAKAESKVHNEEIENVHFHEVGAIDSIVDIIGTAILINHIKPDIILSSVVNDGYGFIECAHGTIPVPVPATCEIFASSDVISRQIDIDTELVTPTGAAIIAELASSYGLMPVMKANKIGWGAGSKDLKIPNVLKVTLGEVPEKFDDVIVMETNIDDCSGEILGYTLEQLFKNKALDAFFTPIYMKKNRPSYRLTVVCNERDIKTIQDVIFRQTTTIGIRYRKEQRTVLQRKKTTIETPFGSIKAKEVKNNNETYIYPEYESLREIAEQNNISIKELYKIIK
jgi:uncharacterized protein (TIGR00299 family) protein